MKFFSNSFRNPLLLAFILLLAISINAKQQQQQFGLQPLGDNVSQPKLLKTESSMYLTDGTKLMTYTILYKNAYNQTINASLSLPNGKGMGFNNLKVQIGEEILEGKVLQKSSETNQTKSEQKMTIYAEMTPQDNSDILSVKIESIPAFEEIKIKFSTSEELENVKNKFFALNYQPILSKLYGFEEQNNDIQEDLTVTIVSDNKIEDIQSSTHDIDNKLQEKVDNRFQVSWKMVMSPQETFQLKFGNEKIHEPHSSLVEHAELKRDYVLVTKILPDLSNEKIETIQEFFFKNSYDIEKTNSQVFENERQQAQVEFIFVLDQSFSMKGERFQQLQNAMVKLLNNMPPKSHFRIMGFASQYTEYHYTSQPVNSQTISQAKNLILGLQANHYGTNMQKPIQRISEIPLISGYPRTILLITDGEENQGSIIDEITKQKSTTRICPIKIGNEERQELIDRIAEVGGCKSIYIRNLDELIKQMEEIFETQITSFLSDVKQTTECLDSNNTRIFYETNTQKYVYKDTPYKIYNFIQDLSEISYCNINISYKGNLFDGERTYNQKVTLDKWTPFNHKNWAHQMAYNYQINQWKLEQKSTPSVAIDEKIKQTSTRYQIPQPETTIRLVNEKYQESLNTENVEIADQKEEKQASSNEPIFTLKGGNLVAELNGTYHNITHRALSECSPQNKTCQIEVSKEPIKEENGYLIFFGMAAFTILAAFVIAKLVKKMRG